MHTFKHRRCQVPQGTLIEFISTAGFMAVHCAIEHSVKVNTNANLPTALFQVILLGSFSLALAPPSGGDMNPLITYVYT
jgi:glycerol uptake facilitator-like aquaporin